MDEPKQKLTKRIRLHKKDPHCFWCGRETTLEGDASKDALAATIDHLYSRRHPERQSKRGHDRTELLHVLSCRECNLGRAVAESKGQVFIPYLYERRKIASATSAVNIPHRRYQSLGRALKIIDPQPMQRRTLCTIEEAIAFAREET